MMDVGRTERARQRMRQAEAEAVNKATNRREQSSRRFNLVPFDKIELRRDCAYLVQDVIPREGLTIVWGPPKCGKSFVVFDLAMHVALDWDFRGRRVSTGPVVYVACEGERGLGTRAAAFRQRRLADHQEAVPFYLITTRLDLVGEHTQLIADISGQIGATTPAAVVIDTLNRSLAGSENNDEDMSAYVQAADAIREAFKCAVIIIHHCGIEGTRPRGHTSLTGAADALIAVKRDNNGVILATVTDMKDGAEGATIASKLEVVVVGTETTGEDIKSCIVVDTEAPPQVMKSKGKRPIPETYWKARTQLTNAIARSGISVSADGIPASARVVTLDVWKAELKQRGMLGVGSRSRNWFMDCKRRLVTENQICIREPYVWIPARR
jgi:AAA domain